MTGKPIDLDDRRSATGKRETEMRRRPANETWTPVTADNPDAASLDARMQVQPARTWIETEKWRFLLDRSARAPDAADDRIQKLIRRALGDMARLRKREERDR